MIKFEHNGVVYNCDTPEEAAKLRILLGDVRTSAGLNRGNIASVMAASTNKDSKEKAELTNFIHILKGLHRTELSGELFARALSLQSVTGLGPRLASLAKRLERYNVSLWEIVDREGRPGQPSIWKINQEALNKVNEFQ